jgi:putative heme-binding domain-containing protein
MPAAEMRHRNARSFCGQSAYPLNRPIARVDRLISAAVLCSFLATSTGALAESNEPESKDSARAEINLEALSRLKGLDLEANPAVKAVVLKVLRQARGTPQFVEIVRDFNLKGQDEELVAMAAKHPTEPVGVDAMRLALQSSDFKDVNAALDGTNGVQIAEVLGNTSQKEIVPLLEPIVSEAGRNLVLRQASVEALAKVQEGATALLKMIRKQKLPEDLRLTASSALNAVRWENLRTEAAQLLPPLKSQTSHPLPPISELVTRAGDATKGASVFRRETVGCIKCHQVNGEGVDFGPNLSEIGTKLAKDALYVSILDPSAGISFGYEAWHLELKNGDDALGLIVSETSDEIALKTVGGIITRYKKNEVATRTKQKLSIMPVGLEQTMSVDDLVDLVSYLSSLKKAAK